jgi:hypothetical protein
MKQNQKVDRTKSRTKANRSSPFNIGTSRMNKTFAYVTLHIILTVTVACMHLPRGVSPRPANKSLVNSGKSLGYSQI